MVSRPTRRRDPAQEVAYVREAAHGICDPQKLSDAMQDRANRLSGEYVADPMLVLCDVDHVAEAVEELVDAANRMVWWLQEHHADDRAFVMFDCLRGLLRLHAQLTTQIPVPCRDCVALTRHDPDKAEIGVTTSDDGYCW